MGAGEGALGAPLLPAAFAVNKYIHTPVPQRDGWVLNGGVRGARPVPPSGNLGVTGAASGQGLVSPTPRQCGGGSRLWHNAPPARGIPAVPARTLQQRRGRGLAEGAEPSRPGDTGKPRPQERSWSRPLPHPSSRPILRPSPRPLPHPLPRPRRGWKRRGGTGAAPPRPARGSGGHRGAPHACAHTRLGRGGGVMCVHTRERRGERHGHPAVSPCVPPPPRLPHSCRPRAAAARGGGTILARAGAHACAGPPRGHASRCHFQQGTGATGRTGLPRAVGWGPDAWVPRGAGRLGPPWGPGWGRSTWRLRPRHLFAQLGDSGRGTAGDTGWVNTPPCNWPRRARPRLGWSGGTGMNWGDCGCWGILGWTGGTGRDWGALGQTVSCWGRLGETGRDWGTQGWAGRCWGRWEVLAGLGGNWSRLGDTGTDGSLARTGKTGPDWGYWAALGAQGWTWEAVQQSGARGCLAHWCHWCRLVALVQGAVGPTAVPPPCP